MATAAIGAYRHSRRSDVGLAGIYAYMDEVIASEFGPEQFVTAQMMRLNVATGHLQWVNAGHPWPLLIHADHTVEELQGTTTLPVGFGGQEPQVSERMLQKGDRLMCFTDGLVEEHLQGEELFGLPQLIEVVSRVARRGLRLRPMARELSQTLKHARGGVTSDDATILLLEWRGGGADHLAVL
jgi:serine phosphatase RsbU (regulator of sigma subunit)